MKNVGIVLIACVVIAVPVFAGQEPAADQPPAVDLNQLMLDFGRVGTTDEIHFVVVHLNDKTTDALFDAPQKYALRAQARNRSMWFVRGVILKDDVTLNLDFRVYDHRSTSAASISHRPEMVSMKNFKNGTELAEGDEFVGILALAQYIPPQTKTILQHGELRFDFTFPRNVLNQLQDN